MIPQQHRYTLENEPRYHGWEIQDLPQEDGPLFLRSALHGGTLCLDMEGDSVIIAAADQAAQDMLADTFDLSPGQPHACTLQAFPAALESLAVALTNAAPAPETESPATVKQRRHQQLYRERQLALWNHACALTGCTIPQLLVASHAKPWASSSPAERLAPYNGFPLEARFDKLFDQGLITFTDTGRIIISSALSPQDQELLTLHPDQQLTIPPSPRHLPYLHYHRKHVFIP